MSPPVEGGAMPHRKKGLPLDLKISVASINLVSEQRYGILKRAVDRSLNCYVICLNL